MRRSHRIALRAVARLVAASSLVAATALPVLAPPAAHAQQAAGGGAADRAPQVDPRTYADMRWRMIGPFRGGRTVAAVGVPQERGVFYIGVTDGGVWKTTDYGRTWNPIFDDQPTGSVGAIAVAPSDPKRIYVGSGEGLQRPDLSTGDGIYRSDDGGKTWTHLGLRDGQQIPMITVDPRDPDRLYVAVLGHPYGPNEERGIFRSTDGGKTFRKVLYRDADTGGMDVQIDPFDPNTVYAVLWSARQAPWELAGGSWTLSERNGLFKSTDGGTTWAKVGSGLPGAPDHLGRIGIAVAPSARGILYAVVGDDDKAGLYRSDDGAASWSLVNTDPRISGRDGDFNEVRVDPKDENTVYVANVVTWKSTDGGRTFTGLRGAPGGDDYHRLWIDPNDPDVILNAADQGAVITVNGGETWSSWYNQPTAQFYHVSTDDAFPYRVCGGQQESGSACVASRSDDGAITFRDWHPVAVEEYGYVAPDPLDPDVVYGGKVTRYDRRTGQVRDVGPSPDPSIPYRVVRTQPLVFSPTDPHTLYFASNTLWKTRDGGLHWDRISPDLTRERPAVPSVLGAFARLDPEKGAHRGVIYTIAPSPVKDGLIWVGTDDGLIHVTHDGGGHWTDVTPPALKSRPWAKISIMDASHSDTLEAYAAVNTFHLDDLRPHVFRTRDGGKTWTEIVRGLPVGSDINTVKEDPERKGLLFAGSETNVWVSFDDGEAWQSLRLNMPATSIRDLVVKDADLVVGTHGRGFWILDDISPLRQATPALASEPAHLFRPANAVRFRWDKWPDTPLPADEPMGQNPPDGVIVDYWLGAAAPGPVTLEVVDGSGRTVRRYASDDVPVPPPADRNIPDYWIRPAPSLSTAAGMHRFVWDGRWTPPVVADHGYPISAVPHDTPLEPRGPWVVPGTYTLRLTVGGKTYSQPVSVSMDPRVSVPAADLQAQLDLELKLVDGMTRATRAATTTTDAAEARRLRGLARRMQFLYRSIEQTDAAPTPVQADAAAALLKAAGG